MHGEDPDEHDIDYRYHSMKATSQGDVWSLDIWMTHPSNTNPAPAPTSDTGSSPIINALEQPGRLARDSYKATVKHITGLDADLTSKKNYEGADDRSERNAFKHAYWSALMTAIGGPQLAKEITDEHEEWGMEHGQVPIDLAMDLINNEIGRDIGSKGIPVGSLVHLLFAEVPLPLHLRQTLIARRILEIRQDLIDRTALAIDQGKLVEISDGRLVSTDGKW